MSDELPPTPETDGLARIELSGHQIVNASFARRLERERDEARQFAKDQLDSFLKSSGELQSHLKLQQHRVAASLILIERGDAERGSLRARVAELEGALSEMTKNRDTVLERLLEKSK